MMFSEKVAQVAEKAGLKIIVKDPTHVQCGFNLGEGRTQLVHLWPVGDLFGQTVIRISTGVSELPAGSIPPAVAEALLVANASFKIGSFGIVEEGPRRLLILSHNMLLETLDPAEFRTVVGTLAGTGDQWERKLGSADKF